MDFGFLQIKNSAVLPDYLECLLLFAKCPLKGGKKLVVGAEGEDQHDIF
ncbi:MAG: hypothetical protein K9K78_06485 [Spirochaetales bacterium]|nr:hypothetical protein [Spirochaetales bacterium]